MKMSKRGVTAAFTMGIFLLLLGSTTGSDNLPGHVK